MRQWDVGSPTSSSRERISRSPRRPANGTARGECPCASRSASDVGVAAEGEVAASQTQEAKRCVRDCGHAAGGRADAVDKARIIGRPPHSSARRVLRRDGQCHEQGKLFWCRGPACNMQAKLQMLQMGGESG